MVAIVEELHLPLLPGQVRAVLLEIVLHGAAAVLSVLQPSVELQHTLLLGHQVSFHLLQGNETPPGLHQSVPQKPPQHHPSACSTWGLARLSRTHTQGGRGGAVRLGQQRRWEARWVR